MNCVLQIDKLYAVPIMKKILPCNEEKNAATSLGPIIEYVILIIMNLA